MKTLHIILLLGSVSTLGTPVSILTQKYSHLDTEELFPCCHLSFFRFFFTCICIYLLFLLLYFLCLTAFKFVSFQVNSHTTHKYVSLTNSICFEFLSHSSTAAIYARCWGMFQGRTVNCMQTRNRHEKEKKVQKKKKERREKRKKKKAKKKREKKRQNCKRALPLRLSAPLLLENKRKQTMLKY